MSTWRSPPAFIPVRVSRQTTSPWFLDLIFPIAKGVTAPGADVGTGFAQCGGKTSFGRTTNIRRAAFETNEQSNGIMEEALNSFDNANQKGWEALRDHHYNVLHKKK